MIEPVRLGQQSLGRISTTAQDQRLVADLDHLGMQVTKENILEIRNILLGASHRLFSVLEGYAQNIQVGPPGGDPISQPAANEFNRKIRPLLAEYRAHADAYKRAGDKLAQIARDYGYSEKAIADSFREYLKAHQGEWGEQLRRSQTAADLPRLFRDLVNDMTTPRTSSRSLEDLFRGGLK